MIEERKHSYGGEEKRDLFSNLINANDELLDDGGQRLGETELIGMGSRLGLPEQLLKCLPFRKHVHLLHGRTRGEDSLVNAEGRLTPSTRQTSGNTLGFALNMLAVHQEEQEALYQHIKSVLPDGRSPVSARGCHLSRHQA